MKVEKTFGLEFVCGRNLGDGSHSWRLRVTEGGVAGGHLLCELEVPPEQFSALMGASPQEVQGTLYTARQVYDVYDREWDLPWEERCPECGQPDNCGDCTHEKLSAEDVLELGGRLPYCERQS